MSVQVFLGYPPENMMNWIESHRPSAWSKIVENLENFSTDMLKDITTIDEIKYNILPSVGSTINVKYKIDVNGEADINDGVVQIPWQVLGYNDSIPYRVKYKNGSNVIYVDTMSNELLTPISNGTNVYKEKEGGNSIGTVSEIGTETFTYGNNCTYSVPTQVMVSGTTYNFAGYNMTIQSQYALSYLMDTDDGKKLFTGGYVSNDHWSQTALRKWLNNQDEQLSCRHIYSLNGTTQHIIKTVPGFPLSLPDEEFTDSVIKTVNRTWVGNVETESVLDSNMCEHVVDKFWVLGVGHLNCKKSDNNTRFYEDQNYDTSNFSGVYSPVDVDLDGGIDARNALIKYQMNENGGYITTAVPWFIKSKNKQVLSGKQAIGCVRDSGRIANMVSAGYIGIVPACTIG